MCVVICANQNELKRDIYITMREEKMSTRSVSVHGPSSAMWNEIPAPHYIHCPSKESGLLLYIAVPAAALLDVVCLIGASILGRNKFKKKFYTIKKKNLNFGTGKKGLVVISCFRFIFARPLPLSVTAPCSNIPL